MSAVPVPRPQERRLLESASLEITGHDAGDVLSVAPRLPARTRVNVTFLGSESPQARLAAVDAVLNAGLTPVPHLASRRLGSEAELRGYLGALADRGAADEVFVVGGDPAAAQGPYGSALDLIRSGLLAEFGVRRVGVAGYPEGHPQIPRRALASALTDKLTALAEQGLQASIITQFGFDEEPVLAWIRDARDAGVGAPIRVGLPGPAGVKRLLGFARRFGISSSASVVRKYGLSLTNLMGTAGPDKLLGALERSLNPAVHGEVGVHFYTFGGLGSTALWLERASGRS